MKKFYPWIILILIIVAALVVRLTPMFFERDFWYDEAFTGIILRMPWAEMNDFIYRDVHPPLFYWLLKPWAEVFSYAPAALRSFSLLFGILLIISTFWIGKKMFNLRAGLLAAAITAFSPFAIIYSSEARMYSLFAFLLIWSVWFFYQALKTNQLKYWILWGIFGGLSFYTHYLSLFFFVLFYLAFAFHRKIFEQAKFFRSLLGTKYFWIGTGIIILFFLSWANIFIGKHIGRKSLGWVESVQLSQIPETLQYFFYGHVPGKILAPEPIGFKNFTLSSLGIDYSPGPFFDAAAIGLVILVLMVGMVVYAWLKNIKRREIFVLSMLSFGTLVLLILVSYFGVKLYVERYFMPAAALVYLLFAGLICSVSRKRWLWILMLGLYGLTLFLLKPMDYKSGWHQISQNQDEILGCCSTVVIDNPFDFASGQYYLGRGRTKMYNRYDPQQDFSLWIIIDEDKIITDTSQLSKLPDFAAIDDKDCNWPNIELKEIGKFDDLSVCKEIK